MSGTAVTFFFFSKRSDILSKTKMKRKADILSHYIHRLVDLFKKSYVFIISMSGQIRPFIRYMIESCN